MATSLLRIGRLGCLKALQLESCGVLRRPAAASLCTQGGDPPTKQAKAPSKTVVAPDERASLLAYKTAVAFPVRLAPTGFSPASPLSEPQPEAIPVGQTTAAGILSPPATPAIEAPLAKEPLLEEASPADHVDAISKTLAHVIVAAHSVDTEIAKEATARAPPFPAELVVAETPVVAKTTASSAPEGPPADGSSSSSSSSSSSDSDSDSDSDSEDAEEEVKTKLKESSATPPSAGEVGVSQDSVTPGADVKDQTGEAEQETPAIETSLVETPTTAETLTTEDADVAVTTAAEAVSGETPEELMDSAPQISAAAESPVADGAPQVEEVAAELPSDPQPTPDTPVETSHPPTPSEEPAVVLETSAEAQVEPESLESAEALLEAPPIVAVDEAPIEVSEAAHVTDTAEVTPGEEDKTPTAETEAPVAEDGPKPVSEVAPDSMASEVQTAAPVEGAEELVDSAPVLTGAAGEELQAEAPAEPEAVEASEEVAAAAPEPEEPFDNTTYKNYEHHNYNTFTFADLDLEMAKHRLPQPSSGRPSPLH